MKLLIAESEGFSPAAAELVESHFDVDYADLQRDELIARLADVHAVWIRLRTRLDEQALANAQNLRYIVTATTGLDHVDLVAAERLGIDVLSLRGEYEFLEQIHATAELTWGLLLSLARRIPAAHQDVLAGRWHRDSFWGWELSDKRLGIVGLGRIGVKLARYGRAFGMRVSAFDPNPRVWPEGVQRHDCLEDVLADSDILCVCVPLNVDTENLIDQRALSMLPSGAVLINTSRGRVVDETALLSALSTGQLGGAAVDVLARELEGDAPASDLVSYAKQHDNVIITPHIGGLTRESVTKTEVFMARKLIEHSVTRANR